MRKVDLVRSDGSGGGSHALIQWLRALLVLIVAGLLVPGCTSSPKNRKGDPLLLSDISGTEAGAGADPYVLRNMGGNISYEYVQLPNGKMGFVPCTADTYFIPWAIIDNLDADTKLKFMQAFVGVPANAAMDVAIASHYAGLSRRKYDERIRGNFTNQIQVDGNIDVNHRKPQRPHYPDPR